ARTRHQPQPFSRGRERAEERTVHVPVDGSQKGRGSMSTVDPTIRGRSDADLLARRWWAILIRGIAAIIFGVLTFVLPGVTLAVMVLLFGAYAVVDGIFSLVA